MAHNARPLRIGGLSCGLGPWSSEPCTHLYTEASGPGCLDSPSPVNWSWCWCGYSGCWVAGQAWSCHSCSERSERADSGWAGVRNASEERETTLRLTHPLRWTRREVWQQRLAKPGCLGEGTWAPQRPLLCGFSCAGGPLMLPCVDWDSLLAQ